MTEDLHAGDHGMQLLAVRPGVSTHGPESQWLVGQVHNIWDVSVGYTSEGTPQVLSFTTTKDAPGAEYLQDYDLAFMLLLWDPRKGDWVEPVNSRFMFPAVPDEDITDSSNTIKYRLVGEIQVLDTAPMHRVPGDWKRNNAYDRAEERYKEQERVFNTALRRFEDLAHKIRRRHGFYQGRVFAYHGVVWLNRVRWVTRGSIAADLSRNGKLFYWNGRQWRGLSNAKWSADKGELRARARTVGWERSRLKKRRQTLDRAERAVRETSRGGKRFFYNSSPGRTLSAVWSEDSAYDGSLPGSPSDGFPTRCKGLWRTWSNAKDSKGRNWPSVSRTHHEFNLGTSLLTMLQDFRERGLIDYQLRGRALDVVPRGGFEVDQSDRIILQVGQNVEAAPERHATDQHYSVAVVVGGNGYSYRVGPNSPSDATAWGFLGSSIRESEADSQSTAERLTSAQRRVARNRVKVEATRSLVLSPSSAIPMIDFEPHHLIAVYDNSGVRARRRVHHVALTWSPDEPMRAVITLEDRFQQTAVNLTRAMSKTMGGVDHIQGHIPMAPELSTPPVWIEPPYAPPITNVSSRVRFDPFTGQPSVILSAEWSDGVLPEPEDITTGEDELLDENDYDPETADDFEPGDPDDDQGIPETVEVD